MGFCHVFAGQVYVVPHHVQRFMPQQFLKRQDVASITNELDGGCPPESMRVKFWHS